MDLLAGVEGFEYGCGNLFYFPCESLFISIKIYYKIRQQ